MRITASIALVVVLVFASVSVADAKRHHRAAYGTGVAAKTCKAERKADPVAFKAKYGNKNAKRAMQRCVRQHVRAAYKTCRTERKADLAAFRAKYGNTNAKRAFRRCVRQHADDPVVAPA